MEFDKKLRNARVRINMTQEKIADELNVSRQTVSNWERGKSLPDIISLIRLSDLYQMSLDDLLKGDSKMIEKIQKDTNIVKSNQIMMKFGWTMLILSVVLSIWNNFNTSNPSLQFINAAAPWVMLGIAIACIVVSSSNKKKMSK